MTRRWEKLQKWTISQRQVLKLWILFGTYLRKVTAHSGFNQSRGDEEKYKEKDEARDELSVKEAKVPYTVQKMPIPKSTNT